MQKKSFFYLLSSIIYLLVLLPSPTLASTLALSPAKGTFNKECAFSLNINLDTLGVETDGSDVIILYDPQKFSASSITNGSIYADFPGNNIDNNAGKISIYALAPTDKGFSGKGVLATVNFTPLATASAGIGTINLDFDPADPLKTTDSNVIEKVGLKDTLTAVTNGSYTIGTGSCLATDPTVTSGIGGGELPASGFVEETWVISILGIFLVLLGSFGLRTKIRNPKHEIRNKL